MNLVKGKTALVTGGAAGIGACIVERLAQEGAVKIAIVDINLDGANRLADQLTKK
jgi:NAD(P)-dependent dehydrogenase (short-subunit alcohol dehydrogenase family)